MIGTDFIRLSQLKFSSNVIEKCLESKLCDSKVDMLISGAFENDDATLLLELSQADRKNKQARFSIIVDRLIFHQFGNYGMYQPISTLYSPTKAHPGRGEPAVTSSRPAKGRITRRGTAEVQAWS